jgi:5-methylcytosine-specific restriction endonuclease McrA
VVLSRKNIIKRDNGRCQYCGSPHKPLTVDHVLPKNRGGEDSWENLVCACVSCNNRKGNRTPDEARMPLFRKPQRPTHIFFMQHFVGVVDERWKPYLFMN